MSPTIAVIGSIVTDIIVRTDRIPKSGENMHVPHIEVMTGGKAANAAVAFTRLGGSAHLIGNTGEDDFGGSARAALTREGVDLTGVGVDPKTPTGSGILLNESNGQTAFMISPGANQTMTTAQLEASLQPLLPIIDGLLFNFEAPEACLHLAVHLARAQDIPIFVDAGPDRPYSPDLWQDATILTPNQPETETIVGYAIDDDDIVIKAARQLLEQGPKIVVLKLGGRGALLATAEETAIIPAVPIEAVDSAGAGDAFTAGLVLATLQRRQPPDAVLFANACGAVAAGRFGTMRAMPGIEEVQALLRTGSPLGQVASSRCECECRHG